MLRRIVQGMGKWPGAWRLRDYLLNTERVAFPEGTVRTRLRFGPWLWVPPNDLMGRNIFYRGLWESPIATHFYTHLRQGDCVLDIGSNIGQYAILAGTKVGPQGRVFAVEPSTLADTYLSRNIRENGLTNVQILRLAAWDKDTTLCLNPGEPTNCGTAHVAETSMSPGVLQVPARRLDGVLGEYGCDRVDVIKIDIEGAELRALQGLSGILARQLPRTVYCELFEGLNDFSNTEGDLLGFFADRGYQAWLFSDAGLVPFQVEMITPGFLTTLLFAINDPG